MLRRLISPLAAACLALAVVAVSTIAWAMTVTPILLDMRASGTQSRSQINVVNDGPTDLPVAISIAAADLDEDGELTTTPASDDFVIFPQTAIIRPGATQVFRVQWAGGADIDRSRSYVFSVAQQPVALPEGVSGVQVLYNFQAVVNVAPARGETSLSAEGAEFTTVDGVRRAVVTVRNPTRVHGYLSRSRVTVTAADDAGRTVWSRTYTLDDLAQRVGIGLIQPEERRRFVLPFDLPEGGTRLTADVRYEARR